MDIILCFAPLHHSQLSTELFAEEFLAYKQKMLGYYQHIPNDSITTVVLKGTNVFMLNNHGQFYMPIVMMLAKTVSY